MGEDEAAATAKGGGRLLILAHAGTWEGRFQVSSLAASAASVGRDVDIALFFAALDHWARDRWDELDDAGSVDAATVESLGMPPLSSLIGPGRDEGRIRLYACSASVRLLALDLADVQDRVDAVLGWQSFSRMIVAAEKVVTL